MVRSMTRNWHWAAIGLFLFCSALLLHGVSHRFGYDVEVADQPALWLVAGLMIAAAAYLFLPVVIRNTLDTGTPSRWFIGCVIVAGLAMRLALFGSEPALEDDFYRYLWDGAVTANGGNPYAHTPDDIWQETVSTPPYGDLARQSGSILERVNYPEYRTIYPAVTQAAFAAAHFLKPWSLDAWRLVILIGELATLGFLAAILATLGRSSLWLALYWWNPVVIKELYNSAHMEAVVMPFVMAGLLLAIRHRTTASSLAFAFGACAKLWPVLLLVLPWRNALRTPGRLAIAIVAAALAIGLCAWPVLASRLDGSSGFVAYGDKWAANDALFLALHWITGKALSVLPSTGVDAGLVARLIAAGTVAATALWINRTPAQSPEEICRRAFIIVTVLFLISPTQYPWYYVWIAPFLVLFPVTGLLAVTATIPLYYSYFHLAPRGMAESFKQGVVWLIWVPVWLLLLRDWIARRPKPTPSNQSNTAEVLQT